jgi:hypothetical protein
MRDNAEYIAVSIVENKESNDQDPDGLMVDGPVCDERGDIDDDGLSFVTANSATATISSTTVENARYRYWFRQTLFPDNVIQVYTVTFAEGPFAIKFFKFTMLTFIGIWTMFYFVRFMVRSVRTTMRP